MAYIYQEYIVIAVKVLVLSVVVYICLSRPLVHKGHVLKSIFVHSPQITKSSQSNNGIDVSHYQGQIDWKNLSREQVNFVYIKATQGITYIDPRLQQNSRDVKTQDIHYGHYHFFEPKDDPVAQAKHFMSSISSVTGNLRPVLDIEITQNENTESIRKGVKRWLEHVGQASGCIPIIYTYADYWQTHFSSGFSDYGFWLADYAKKPNPPASNPNWLIWQYSQKGRVKSIPGTVDLDKLNSDVDLDSLRCIKD